MANGDVPVIGQKNVDNGRTLAKAATKTTANDGTYGHAAVNNVHSWVCNSCNYIMQVINPFHTLEFCFSWNAGDGTDNSGMGLKMNTKNEKLKVIYFH